MSLEFGQIPAEPRAGERRRQVRLRIGGSARLTLDSATRPVTRMGQTIDLSRTGCAIRVYKPVEEDRVVEVEFEVAGRKLCLPATVTRVVDDKHSFRVGCRVDPLYPETQAALDDLLRKRRQRVW